MPVSHISQGTQTIVHHLRLPGGVSDLADSRVDELISPFVPWRQGVFVTERKFFWSGVDVRVGRRV
jgi:hypothetical protein